MMLRLAHRILDQMARHQSFMIDPNVRYLHRCEWKQGNVWEGHLRNFLGPCPLRRRQEERSNYYHLQRKGTK